MRAVDLFAGWGGFTLAAEQAGVRVVWAANHWQLAVEAHAANHPEVAHVCQDLRQADWSRLPGYDLLLASPACQGHSEAGQPARAKGGALAQRHDEMRATAWAVVDCADATEPQVLIVENVPQFREWRLYPLWLEALRRIGYEIEERVLCASHYDVPQRRNRLFIVGVRGRRPDLRQLDRLGREPAFGPCIEWDSDADWRVIAGTSADVQARIRKGRARCGDRFLTQHVTGHPGVPLDEPIRTITTKDQWAVVDRRHYRPLTLRENARGMGFPDSYAWPSNVTRRDVITGLGNAVPPPLARSVILAVA